MQRSLILVALMVLAAIPAATAHNPPGPVLTCQNVLTGDGKYHDYLPPNTGYIVIAGDGNLEDCPKKMDITWGPIFDPTLPPCAEPAPALAGEAPWCEEEKLANQFIFEYDGELDHAIGGAFLFVNSGDATSGVTACYGWPAVGHHSTTVYAQDILGFGPQFSVTADYSRPGLEETPDCGDNYVEPCIPNPPPDSEAPFPANVVIDTVNDVLYLVFGPGGAGCNDLDQASRCASTPVGPSRCLTPFGPGADGALVVFIEPDYDNARIPTFGHVWTS